MARVYRSRLRKGAKRQRKRSVSVRAYCRRGAHRIARGAGKSHRGEDMPF